MFSKPHNAHVEEFFNNLFKVADEAADEVVGHYDENDYLDDPEAMLACQHVGIMVDCRNATKKVEVTTPCAAAPASDYW